MGRRGLGVLFAAFCACKQTPPPAVEEKPHPVIDAGAPAEAAKKPPAVEPLFDPALKEGAFATWDVQSLSIPQGSRATFTVLTITDEAVEVGVSLKVSKGNVPAALEKGLRFLMLRAPLQAQPGLMAPGASGPVHSDIPFRAGKAEVVMAGGRPVQCFRVASKAGDDDTHGCIGAKLSPIGFFGGAVELEEPHFRVRLVEWGVNPAAKSDAPLAFKPGQTAVYNSDGAGIPPINDTWLTGGNRVRYATSEPDASWEGTLLEVLFDLATLEKPDGTAYQTSYRVNGDRFAAVTFKSLSHGPNGEAITEEWLHAEDPWRPVDAPVWVRFWPLEHGVGTTEIDATRSLAEWK